MCRRCWCFGYFFQASFLFGSPRSRSRRPVSCVLLDPRPPADETDSNICSSASCSSWRCLNSQPSMNWEAFSTFQIIAAQISVSCFVSQVKGYLCQKSIVVISDTNQSHEYVFTLTLFFATFHHHNNTKERLRHSSHCCHNTCIVSAYKHFCSFLSIIFSL
jgi:hypothetical protein